MVRPEHSPCLAGYFTDWLSADSGSESMAQPCHAEITGTTECCTRLFQPKYSVLLGLLGFTRATARYGTSPGRAAQTEPGQTRPVWKPSPNHGRRSGRWPISPGFLGCSPAGQRPRSLPWKKPARVPISHPSPRPKGKPSSGENSASRPGEPPWIYWRR